MQNDSFFIAVASKIVTGAMTVSKTKDALQINLVVREKMAEIKSLRNIFIISWLYSGISEGLCFHIRNPALYSLTCEQ